MRAVLSVAAIASVFFMGQGYAADTPVTGTPDPMSLDVAGVRLGMTPDEAQAALQKFDAGFKIEKLYVTNEIRTYDERGLPLARISDDRKPVAYFTSLSAVHQENPPPTNNCAGAMGSVNGMSGMLLGTNNCGDVHHDDEDQVRVYFSPVPGHEQVVGVVRDKTIHLTPPPTVDANKQGILAKYAGLPPTFDGWTNQKSQYSLTWLFDGKKRLLSEASANGKSRNDQFYTPASGASMPSWVMQGDGVSLRAVITTQGSQEKANFVSSISVGLSDGDGLVNSFQQAKATFKQLKEKVDAAELAKSANSPSKTKF